MVRKYYRHYFTRFDRKATRIVTVSEYSRRDIINNYEVLEDKVDLAYNGANERFKPISEEKANDIRSEISGGSPYFVFVGSLHPRKNITNLLKAFQLFKDEDKISLDTFQFLTIHPRAGIRLNKVLMCKGRAGPDARIQVVQCRARALGLTLTMRDDGQVMELVAPIRR